MGCNHNDHHKDGERDGHKSDGSYEKPHDQGVLDWLISPNSSEKIQDNKDYDCGFRKGRDERDSKK